jgi:hypothetical protein
MMGDFVYELEQLINKFSKENGSDTPDYILAEYLKGCLELFDKTVALREMFYGRKSVSETVNVLKKEN